jgi:MinD superfamily P-loop ATPase
MPVKELVVISGKGGTGKTSIVASFAALEGRKIVADCDVDAADLHLLLRPEIIHRESFKGGKKARIKAGHCIACGKCEEICRFDAIYYDGPGNGRVSKTFRIDPISCEGCGICAHFCEEMAIEFKEVVNGEWYISDTRFAQMVHAKLGIAESNSGKLVTLIRNKAKEIGEAKGIPLLLIDGSPGIGCPVIASITGADLICIVSEPTMSGQHDMDRVYQLANHFNIPCVMCINKYDLNTGISREIETWCEKRDIPCAGRIPYDRAFTESQVKGLTVVEYSDGPAASAVRELWNRIREYVY